MPWWDRLFGDDPLKEGESWLESPVDNFQDFERFGEEDEEDEEEEDEEYDDEDQDDDEGGEEGDQLEAFESEYSRFVRSSDCEVIEGRHLDTPDEAEDFCLGDHGANVLFWTFGDDGEIEIHRCAT